jgi:5-methylcytosine-specific restriction endonuclease McrA
VSANDTPLALASYRTFAPHAVPVVANNSRRARAARKRTRRVKAVVNDLTAVQWTALKSAWNGCAYCGVSDKPLQRDCVMAISRGGRYTIENVVPACAACNASKCNDEVTGWMRRKRLDERLFLERYVRIRSQLDELAAAEPMTSTVTSG